MSGDERLHRPAGSLAAGRWAVDLDPGRAGWTWASLRVLTLGPGEAETIGTGQAETLVLPLAGSCSVTCGGERLELAGRASVFEAVTDFAYLPRHAEAVIASEAGGRFALPAAVADRDLPFRYGPASGVGIELRGAGACSRQVNNFCTADAFAADRLLACEVITPAGNWSSYPPHKHDEDRPGESVLEEIYYFELSGPGPAACLAGTASAITGSTAPRTARSTCSPRSAPVTWCWFRTAGTGRRWPCPVTTCTT